MNICVYGASSNTIDSSYIEQTEYLGRQMAKRGHSLVYGAGANGLMGAVARGVHEEHGKSSAWRLLSLMLMAFSTRILPN